MSVEAFDPRSIRCEIIYEASVRARERAFAMSALAEEQGRRAVEGAKRATELRDRVHARRAF